MAYFEYGSLCMWRRASDDRQLLAGLEAGVQPTSMQHSLVMGVILLERAFVQLPCCREDGQSAWEACVLSRMSQSNFILSVFHGS